MLVAEVKPRGSEVACVVKGLAARRRAQRWVEAFWFSSPIAPPRRGSLGDLAMGAQALPIAVWKDVLSPSFEAAGVPWHRRVPDAVGRCGWRGHFDYDYCELCSLV